MPNMNDMNDTNNTSNTNNTNNRQNTASNSAQSQNKGQSTSNQTSGNKAEDKINLDYDWNSEYGDGDIPDIDKK